MKITNLWLQGYGGFENAWLEPAPTAQCSGNITILIGNNGAGKTLVLKSLATLLSWLIARIRSEKGVGNPILEQDICNQAMTAHIHIRLTNDARPEACGWSLAKTRSGRLVHEKSQLQDLTELAKCYRTQLTENPQTALPLIAYYPVDRGVIDIPLKIRTRHTFDQLDGYDNAVQLGVDFRRFFEWFREQEDIENADKLKALELLNSVPAPELGVLDKERVAGIEPLPNDKVGFLLGQPILNHQAIAEVYERVRQQQNAAINRNLEAVRQAITDFIPDFSQLRIERKPRLRMVVSKSGEDLDVAQLSQGEKTLMALVGDIARRLAMMNPSLKNPLEGQGIVLIDEIDLHLHPNWQRRVVGQLANTFPNCQFILSTHSPQVISDSPDLLCYLLERGEIKPLPNLFGLDVNQVLLDAMDSDIRNSDIDAGITAMLEAIQDGQIEQARQILTQLEHQLPESHLELSKARLLLRKMELRRAQN